MRREVGFPAAVFSAAFAFFYNLQFSTPNIPGFDGFYHIKLAALIKDRGLIDFFPWFQHTFWKEHFVDIHFLYHISLIPFTAFDLVYGAKISTVVFFSAMAVLFYILLRVSKVPLAWVWVAILFMASPKFLYRASLPRAPLTALCLLFLGAIFILRKNYKAQFLLAFFFVWTYGGFTLLIVLTAFMALTRWIDEGSLDRNSLLSVFFGVVAATVINPYFPENVGFLFTQTFSAGISRVVAGGMEWRPFMWRDLLESHLGLFAAFLSCGLVLAFARIKPRPDTQGWILFSAFTLYLTLNSMRFIEYFAPTFVLASALLFRDGWFFWERFCNEGSRAIASSCAGILVLAIIAPHQWEAAQKEMHDSREPGRYKKAALWLKEHTPGVAVFNADWDDFPELFFFNSENKYVVGLDPAFLYLYDPILYRQWIDISSGSIKEDPYPILKNRFKTPYLFTDNEHGGFMKLMDNHPLIRLEYQDAHARIYSLK